MLLNQQKAFAISNQKKKKKNFARVLVSWILKAKSSLIMIVQYLGVMGSRKPKVHLQRSLSPTEPFLAKLS